MDQYNPNRNPDESETSQHEIVETSPPIEKPELPPPSHFSKDFVKFAGYLAAYVFPLIFGLDWAGGHLQDLSTEAISSSGATIRKDVASGLVFFAYTASFAVFWFGKNFVQSRKAVKQLWDYISTMENHSQTPSLQDQSSEDKKEAEIAELRERSQTNMRILRTIHNQIYADSTSRLNFNALKGTYYVNAQGDLKAHKFLSVKADEKEGHFWTFYAEGDEYSRRLDKIEDMKLFVSSSEADTNITYITTIDEELKKQFAIYFLPLLQPGETRSFTLYYEWPGMFRKLLEVGSAVFDWNNRSATTGKIGNFYAEWIFDEHLGPIDCQNTGSRPSGLRLNQTNDSAPSKWILEGEQIALGNIPYELTFFATSKNSGMN